jgi:hypothetical protein
MRKAIYVAILLVVFAVPVYASSFGDSLTGSGNWGLKVANALKGGKGLYGQSTNTEGGGIGVQGVSTGRSGRGVYGLAKRGGGKNIGVFGESTSNSGKGVMGFASKASGTTYGVYGRANSPDGWGLYTPNNAYVGSDLQVDGDVLDETPVAFLAYNSASDVRGTASTNVHLDSEKYDYGSNFAGNAFTAPSTGVYQFNAVVCHGDLDTGIYVQLHLNVNGVNAYYLDDHYSDSAGRQCLSGSATIQLTAGDTVRIRTVSGDSSWTIEGNSVNSLFTHFSGHRVN